MPGAAIKRMVDPVVSGPSRHVEDYIASLSGATLRAYARDLWAYLSGTSGVLPEPVLFGLAPIESRVVDDVLARFVDEEDRAPTPRPDIFS
jgi:hypothetical protein